ncbi:hypothetical protein, partial [Streptomyces roseolus]|uniref:hypothetical protein n=1 Tax=Streptomyces roseolus TaxID=67358 RepID=UPI003660D912
MGANAMGEAAAAATAAATPTNRRLLKKVFCIKALPPKLIGPLREPTTSNADYRPIRRHQPTFIR